MNRQDRNRQKGKSDTQTLAPKRDWLKDLILPIVLALLGGSSVLGIYIQHHWPMPEQKAADTQTRTPTDTKTRRDPYQSKISQPSMHEPEELPANVAATFSLNDFYVEDESGNRASPGDSITVPRGAQVTAHWKFLDGNGTMTKTLDKKLETVDVPDFGDQIFVVEKSFTLKWTCSVDSYTSVSDLITIRVGKK